MTIDGAKILTPGGKRMTGEYDRHGFSYVAPEGEPGAGATITLEQLNDEIITVRTGEEPAGRVWKRCSLTTS